MTEREREAAVRNAASFFNRAMGEAEEAVMLAERLGGTIEGAEARASNLALDCVDMDRNAKASTRP